MIFILYVSLKFGIEKSSKEKQLQSVFVFMVAINICLRALINKPTNITLTSQTSKLMIVVLMTFCFVILSYYRAQMNAALNVDLHIFPINSWEEVDKSNYIVLAQKSSVAEDKFKYAPNGTVLKKIYYEKISSVSDNELIGAVGFEKSIHTIMNGDSHIVYESLELYERSPDYPCNIIDIKHLQ